MASRSIAAALLMSGLLLPCLAAPARAQTFQAPAPVVLPQDDAPHHSQAEWWYTVGHLTGVDPSGASHEYGYELTVFQIWPLPLGPATYSWHLAITDVNNKTFNYEEKAQIAPIPNETDSVSLSDGNWSFSGGQNSYALKAQSTDGRFGLDLQTTSAIPAALHDGNGLIPFGSFGPSSYYSFTALNTTGTLYDNGVPIQVTGISWQDRQWFNIQGMAGWNWFSVQLDNNTQYMLFFIQDFPSGAISQKVGTKVVNGVATPVDPSQMSFTVLDYWLSPKSLFLYPSKWKLTVPEGTMTVTPLVQDQELVWPGHRSYYEGDSSVVGVLNGQPVTGRSYAEVNPSFEPLVTLP